MKVDERSRITIMAVAISNRTNPAGPVTATKTACAETSRAGREFPLSCIAASVAAGEYACSVAELTCPDLGDGSEISESALSAFLTSTGGIFRGAGNRSGRLAAEAHFFLSVETSCALLKLPRLANSCKSNGE